MQPHFAKSPIAIHTLHVGLLTRFTEQVLSIGEVGCVWIALEAGPEFTDLWESCPSYDWLKLIFRSVKLTH